MQQRLLMFLDIPCPHEAVWTQLNDEQRQYAENIGHSATALLAIINDILDFSKVEAGTLKLDAVRTDIVPLSPEARLSELAVASVRDDLPVLPIGDDDGRVVGLVEPVDLLRGIARELGVETEEDEGA